MFELVELGGGLQTLRDRETGETFHPGIGPMAEARAIHVAPLELERRLREEGGCTIWEVGFGAAANAVAVLEELEKIGGPFRCRMLSFDRTLAPLQFALEHARELVYPLKWRAVLTSLAEQGATRLTFSSGGELSWILRLQDFTENFAAEPPHAVIYDPYSPARNPAMWSLRHFAQLRRQMTKPAVLTSYTRSTAVRVTLLRAGFYVGSGSATGAKEETTVAATTLGLLQRPLPRAWLQRVRASTNGRPLDGSGRGAISGEDFAALEAHLQFGGGGLEGD